MAKKLRRVIALVLAAAMVMSLGISSVLADEADAADEVTVTITAVETDSYGEVTQVTLSDGTVYGDTAEDSYVTLVVDGIETAIEEGLGLVEGTYSFTETGIISALYDSTTAWGGMTSGQTGYRTGVYVTDDAVDYSKSVTDAVSGGEITDTSVSNAVIDSDNENFNGITIYSSTYSISNLTITADGNGTNDFTGYGAGIAVGGASDVTVDNYVFFGSGSQRHGVYVGSSEIDEDGNRLTAYVTVSNSYIRASADNSDGSLGSGCPWMLGISANGVVRATMLDGYAIATYDSCILLSDGWGILSTDDMGEATEWAQYTGGVRVYSSVVDVTLDTYDDPSAYATYSIGACKNIFYDSVIGYGSGTELFETIAASIDTDYDLSYDTVKYGLTYACVVANEYASVEFYNSTITTKYGVMYHKTNNVSYVSADSVFAYEDGALDNSSDTYEAAGATVVENSTFNTYGAAFLIKACTPVIKVTNSTFNSETGVIVQLMTCDDPGMGASSYSEALDAATVDADDGETADAGVYDKYSINTKSMTIFDWDIENMINDVLVYFTDCDDLEGDIYNSIAASTTGEGMTWWGQNLVVYMENSTITGVISSSSSTHLAYSFYIAYDEDGNEVYVDENGRKYSTTETSSESAMGTTVSLSINTDEDGNYLYDDTDDTIYTPVEGAIVSDNATYLGGVTNVASAAVNNGVLLSLESTTWNVTGTSYLTGLYIDDASSIVAANGGSVVMTVDGVEVEIVPGTYSGDIVITVESSGAVSSELTVASVVTDSYGEAIEVVLSDGTVYGSEDGTVYVTLVVDGIETGIEEGLALTGDYSFTETGIISALYDSTTAWGGMTSGQTGYRTGIYVYEDAIDYSKSVTDAVDGSYDDTTLYSATILSNGENFNGVTIYSASYIINNLTIIANGNGSNDFTGYGAGIAVGGASDVTINNYIFIGSGSQRHGVYVGSSEIDEDGNILTAYVTVNNSYIRASADNTDGSLGSGCPWMLGISASGVVRATMLDGYAIATYNSSILLSDGWGILSTDDMGEATEWAQYTGGVRVNNSVVDVTTDTYEDPSAYATYSIGACLNIFTDCVIGYAADSDLYNELVAGITADDSIDLSYETVKYGLTYASVVANEYASVEFYNSTITTKYGVMYHKTNNVSYVSADSVFAYEDGALDNSSDTYEAVGATIVENSTFNTYGAAFLIKACTPVIKVTNSTFNSETGVIVQLMTCDDPGMGASSYSEALDAATVDADDGETADAGVYSKYAINTKSMTIFDWDIENMINDVLVYFTDCDDLEGDIYNSIAASTTGEGMTWWGQNLVVYMDNSTITGVISSSSSTHLAYSFYIAYDDEGNEVYVDENGRKYSTTETSSESAMGTTVSLSINTDEDGNYLYDDTDDTIYTPVEGAIVSDNATYLGGVTNVASAAVNNGVLLSLEATTWNVTGTSYLTGLYIDETSAIVSAVEGYDVVVTLDGEEIELVGGTTYSGDIVVELVESAAAADTSADTDTTDDSEAAAVGDTSDLALWMMLAAFAILGCAVAVEKRKFN